MPRAAKATPAKKSAVKKAAKPAPKKTSAAKKAAPAKKVPAAKKATPAKAPAKAPVKKIAAAAKKAPVRRAEGAQATQKPAAPAKVAPPKPPAKPKKVVLDKFALEQRDLLKEERARHLEQAQELKAEADQIAADMEPGDVQFDEESGEGTTTAIDRERDLALSMQAQGEVEEVDHALAKIAAGTYGACERCGQQIPKARLKAIPHARLCIACKSGGLSRR